MICGASPDDWKHWTALGLTADLLPVVSDLSVPIDPGSTLKALGKTPSIVKANGRAVGLSGWTKRVTTVDDIARWRADDRLGIAVQCRTVRAIDIDVEDAMLARKIEHVVGEALDGLCLPMRYRDNSGKCLLAFRHTGEMRKRTIPVEGGIIEFLGDGQQFIAAGQHVSGYRYRWDSSANPPTLTGDDLERVWSALVAQFATGEPTIARQKRESVQLEGVYKDELAAWLVDNWQIYGEGQDGQLFLECPFVTDHTAESGDTSTAYFISGTGGYERGHWVCLHAHCAARTDEDFTQATGYCVASFKPLAAAVPADRAVQLARWPDRPNLTRGKDGAVKPTAINMLALLEYPPMMNRALAFDAFKGEIVWIPVGDDGSLPEKENWRAFTDADYYDVRCRFERHGIDKLGKDLLREAVHRAAMNNVIDTAQIWLASLKWDGASRVPTFLSCYFGVRNSAYAAAVSSYLWTALAGRVLEPGVQADMVPVFIGAQGARKTSAIKAIVPDRINYTTINMTQRDTDLSRIMRGKLLGELEELRGINSRDAEDIKAWITRTEEEWVPKFKEFGTTFKRRLVFVGSGNDEEFLADATGERRYLPMHAGVAGRIDPEAVARDRNQLWAEAAMRFRLTGVDWQDAERLAAVEHRHFKVPDGWTATVRRWLSETDMTGRPRERGALLSSDILSGAIGMSIERIDRRAETRMRKVMLGLGWKQDSNRHWTKESPPTR